MAKLQSRQPNLGWIHLWFLWYTYLGCR